nr:structural toxin protein RtxA [Colwellia sp.]
KLTLNADGSYEYVATADSISANAQDVFTYTVKDGDGDLATTTLTINVADVSISGTETTATVDEAGLDGIGTDEASDKEKVINGDLNLATGTTVEAQSGTASFGTWSIDTAGKFNYTLTNNTDDAANADETDSFSYTAKDANGNTVTNTVKITIIDDAPVAVADTGSVTEGATLTVAALSGVLADDTAGADGWEPTGAVVGVATGTSTSDVSGNVASEIVGQYGKLTLNADGSYEYVATADSISANAQDVFTYTVKDGDGDLATTTLTINV